MRRRRSLPIRIVASVLLTSPLWLTACGGGEGGGSAVTPPPPPPPVTTTSVAVTPQTVALAAVGSTASLTATVNTSAGVAASPAVTWTSSAPGVATVSGSGTTATVTAVGPGTAQITASSGGQSGSATVTVTPPATVTAVSVAPATLALTGIGVTGQLTATVTTSAGVAASPTVTWTSSNPSIATVAGTGATATVTSVAPGAAQITASAGGQSGVAAVTVSPPMPALALSVSTPQLAVQAGGPAGQLVARLRRTNLPGAVTLTATGAPAGLVVSFTPVVVSGDSSVVTLTAVTTTVPGTYALTIRASTSGVAAQTAALSVQVQAPPAPTGNVVLDLTSCADQNGWMVVRNGDSAPWVQVMGQSGRYRFDAAGERVSLAYRSFSESGRQRTTNVVHGTAAEIGSLMPDQLCALATPLLQRDPSPKQFGLQWQPPAWANPQDAFSTAHLGGFLSPIGLGPVNVIEGPGTGEHDLFVLVANSSGLASLVVRRDIDVTVLPNGSVLTAPIDFRSAESRALRPATVRIEGAPTGGRLGFEPFVAVGDSCDAMFLPRDQLYPGGGPAFFLLALSQRRSFNRVFGNPWGVGLVFEDALRSPTSPTAESIVGWPESQVLRPNELYGGIAVWWTGAPLIPNSESRRVVSTSLTPEAVRLPSGMPEVTPTILPDTAYRRLRFQFVLPSDVADAAVVHYAGQSNGHALSIRQFRSQRSGAAVDLTTPDFTGTPGWDSTLGPRGLARFEVRGESNTRTNACRPGRTLTSSRFGVS
jgi:hypothetical protein